jgi:hypothetical protein
VVGDNLGANLRYGLSAAQDFAFRPYILVKRVLISAILEREQASNNSRLSLELVKKAISYERTVTCLYTRLTRRIYVRRLLRHEPPGAGWQFVPSVKAHCASFLWR